MPKRIITVLGFTAIAFFLLLNLPTLNQNNGELVTQVVDGDSFFIENKQTIRIYGIDAPELSFCFGKEAKEKLKSLIAGKKVILKEPKTDGFGRILALVYVNGVLVNEEMMKNGFAEYRRQAGSETETLRIAAAFARENKKGIYSPLCSQKAPPDPKCTIKGNIDKEKGKKMYFLPNCRTYSQIIIEKFRGEDWFCNEKEAKAAGFAKSTTCL